MNKMIVSFCSILFVFATPLSGEEVAVRSPSGEISILNIESDQRFSDVIHQLEERFQGHEEFILDFRSTSASVKKKTTNSPARDFYAEVSPAEKKEIAYVVNTLGMSSLSKIAKEKSSLKKTEKKIVHIHPFKFLITIFTDDQMKASILSMHNRGWVWSEFYSNLKETLEEEYSKDNLIPYTQDLASSVGIPVNLLEDHIAQREWSSLIDVLLKNVPRNVDAKRYDM